MGNSTNIQSPSKVEENIYVCFDVNFSQLKAQTA